LISLKEYYSVDIEKNYLDDYRKFYPSDVIEVIFENIDSEFKTLHQFIELIKCRETKNLEERRDLQLIILKEVMKNKPNSKIDEFIYDIDKDSKPSIVKRKIGEELKKKIDRELKTTIEKEKQKREFYNKLKKIQEK
jgi:hypothetical protein